MPTPSRPRAEIALVRHGRSAHVEPRWLDVEGVRRWMAAYDAAAIAPEHPPPPALVALARSADLVVSSDLPRALASAALLAGGRDVAADPLFREAALETAELPLPALAGVRLPLHGWALAFALRWVQASRRGLHAGVVARADAAAAWLADHAAGRRLVLVVTHGTFRTVLAAALARRGWRPPSRRPFREWSVWRLPPDEPAAGRGGPHPA